LSVTMRLATDSIKAGYLRRVPSQLDGRRAVLELSPEGVEFMARFRKQQRAAFEYITAQWSEADRLDFARLMLRYVDAIDDLKNRKPTAEA
ncbi:MarR family transcriptional regulator, partial [Nocardia sp. NPDC004722]